MRIFITGASGFIGKHILQVLCKKKDELLLLAKDEQDCKLLTGYNGDVVVGDLSDVPSFKKDVTDFSPQVCLHLAWEGIPDFSYEMCKKNIDTSTGLINLLINETKCKKILISGSCYEYGKTKGICKESDIVNINSFISWAKYSLYCCADIMCRNANVDLIWFRIFYIYGPGQRKESLIPMLVRSFKEKIDPGIKNPFDANDFVYVGDVAEAFRIAISNKIEPGIYNLGSGKSTKVIDVCEIVEKQIFGRTEISSSLRKNSNSKQEGTNFWADINKTKRNLSWKPKMSILNGIKKYLNQEGVM